MGRRRTKIIQPPPPGKLREDDFSLCIKNLDIDDEWTEILQTLGNIRLHVPEGVIELERSQKMMIGELINLRWGKEFTLEGKEKRKDLYCLNARILYHLLRIAEDVQKEIKFTDGSDAPPIIITSQGSQQRASKPGKPLHPAIVFAYVFSDYKWGCFREYKRKDLPDKGVIPKGIFIQDIRKENKLLRGYKNPYQSQEPFTCDLFEGAIKICKKKSKFSQEFRDTSYRPFLNARAELVKFVEDNPDATVRALDEEGNFNYSRQGQRSDRRKKK